MEQNNLEFSTLICVCTENATAYPRQARSRVVFQSQSSIAIDIWTHVFKTGRVGLVRVTLPPSPQRNLENRAASHLRPLVRRGFTVVADGVGSSERLRCSGFLSDRRRSSFAVFTLLFRRQKCLFTKPKWEGEGGRGRGREQRRKNGVRARNPLRRRRGFFFATSIKMPLR